MDLRPQERRAVLVDETTPPCPATPHRHLELHVTLLAADRIPRSSSKDLLDAVPFGRSRSGGDFGNVGRQTAPEQPVEQSSGTPHTEQAHESKHGRAGDPGTKFGQKADGPRKGGK